MIEHEIPFGKSQVMNSSKMVFWFLELLEISYCNDLKTSDSHFE
jgi:hypothetical protein